MFKFKLSFKSPFIGAELAIRSKYEGYKRWSVAYTYPETLGTGSTKIYFDY